MMREMMARGLAPRFDGSIDPDRLRAVVQSAQERMPSEPGVSFHPCELGGIEAEQSLPDNAGDSAVILYIHGGGLICGSARTSRGYASLLAGETKLPVYSISYRLAPEHPSPAALDDCFAAYRALLELHPALPMFLIGESGGAYLSIVTALWARDEGHPSRDYPLLPSHRLLRDH